MTMPFRPGRSLTETQDALDLGPVDLVDRERRERIATAVLAGFAVHLEASIARLEALRQQHEALDGGEGVFVPSLEDARQATVVNAVRWADALIAELDK